MRAEHKDGEEYASDMDLCDLDVENVDDLFDGNDAPPPKKEKRKRSAASQAKAVANGVAGSVHNTASAVKQPDRLWDEKFAQSNGNANGGGNGQACDDAYKGFYQIDSLLVVNDTTLQPVSSSSSTNTSKTRRSGKQPAQMQTNNSNKSLTAAAGTASAAGTGSPGGDECSKSNSTSNSTSSRSSSRKKASKASKSLATTGSTSNSNSSARPRMIHTEKSRVPQENVSKKTGRGRTYVTRTNTSETSQLGLVKSSNVASSRIVDDYEIISPALQPPNQISSSPLHIKQEQEQQQRVQLMYDDTHLLIDAGLLREKTYEKFNPSIVNDLEEILRSPLKHDRNARLRFTSESSTTPQFLPEEEQNLIKIEPTSPDLREMVESQQRVTSAGHGATPTSSSSSARTSRHLRQLTANSSFRTATKRGGGGSSTSSSNNSRSKTDSASSSKKSSTVAASSKTSSYLNYGVDSYNVNSGTNASSSDVSSGFFSISEVVSAADAADAAAKAAAANKSERRTRCFECEMCSANFPDRAQLLEHVHIHI